jgi:succinyl-CoA synthetase beta subunit
LRSLRGATLLTGGRGGEPVAIAAAANIAIRVGELLLERDLDVVELNPVIVDADGAIAVDALIL